MEKTLIVFGIAFIFGLQTGAIIFLGRKTIHNSFQIDTLLEVVEHLLDESYQEIVDEEFEEIVDNIDDLDI